MAEAGSQPSRSALRHVLWLWLGSGARNTISRSQLRRAAPRRATATLHRTPTPLSGWFPSSSGLRWRCHFFVPSPLVIFAASMPWSARRIFRRSSSLESLLLNSGERQAETAKKGQTKKSAKTYGSPASSSIFASCCASRDAEGSGEGSQMQG